MEVSFEVVSTQWKDYLLISVFVLELWHGRIMSSENATFAKNSIFNKQCLPCRELFRIDENHFGPRVYPKGSLVIALARWIVRWSVRGQSVFKYHRECTLVI